MPSKDSFIPTAYGSRSGIVLRVCALIAAFWLLGANYLFDYFSSDDFMNLFQSFHKGWTLLRGVALFWSGDVARPVGGLIYAWLYAIFGLHPLPFKLVMLLLLIANLLIAWRVATLLLADSRLGAMVAVLFLYHASEAGDIWYNFGNFSTIYDIVCFTFMYSALWIWLRARRAGRFPRAPEIALMCVLEILALGSKEMAVALPVLILLYELFWGGRNKAGLDWKVISAIGLFALITLAFLIGKRRGAASLLNDPLYRPVFSWHFYFQNMSHYLNLLFYSGNMFRAGRTTWFLAGGLVISVLFRTRAMAFGWLWFLVGMLPIAVIPARGGSVLYIPSLGLAVALVEFLRRAFELAEAKLSGPAGKYLNPASTPVFVACLICVTAIHWHFKQTADSAPRRLSAGYRSFAADLQRAGGQGSFLLFVRDPFALDRYDPQFIAALVRDQPNLHVGRARSNQALLSPAVATIYDEVFDFENGHLQRVRKSNLPVSLERARAQFGAVDPVSGLSITPNEWWLAKKEFTVAIRCPAAQSRCEFAFDLIEPSGTGAGSGMVSMDVGGLHWRDIPIPANSQTFDISVPLQKSARTIPVRFVADNPRPLILSGVHVR